MLKTRRQCQNGPNKNVTDVFLYPSCFARVNHCWSPPLRRDVWTCQRRSDCYEWTDGNNVSECKPLRLSAGRCGNTMEFLLFEIRYRVSWASIWGNLLLIISYLQLATLMSYPHPSPIMVNLLQEFRHPCNQGCLKHFATVAPRMDIYYIYGYMTNLW